MQHSSLLFHQDFVKQLKGADPRQRIQPQREKTNHEVQALCDATRIGTTEIISAVRLAAQVRTNIVGTPTHPSPCLATGCTARATLAEQRAFPTLPQFAIQATFIARLLSISDDRENAMKLPSAAVAASLVCLIVAPVFAQTAPPAASTATVPVPATRRVTCLATTASLKGQDKRDQMQLCLAQARLDCLKQAIDQKVVGEPRKNFIKTCVGGDGPGQH
ncbi:hypothetical protein [Bradyrhizobium sp. Bra78]|uniref:hypothetical protein n=1 Tax=Bradyrhizobium sp. Bra78 TaxID=2926010 RepID=UPI0039672915